MEKGRRGESDSDGMIGDMDIGGGRGRERERKERARKTQRKTHRETESHGGRERQLQRETDRERQREIERDRKTQRETERERESFVDTFGPSRQPGRTILFSLANCFVLYFTRDCTFSSCRSDNIRQQQLEKVLTHSLSVCVILAAALLYNRP